MRSVTTAVDSQPAAMRAAVCSEPEKRVARARIMRVTVDDGDRNAGTAGARRDASMSHSSRQPLTTTFHMTADAFEKAAIGAAPGIRKQGSGCDATNRLVSFGTGASMAGVVEAAEAVAAVAEAVASAESESSEGYGAPACKNRRSKRLVDV
jgi:hypothetical protein